MATMGRPPVFETLEDLEKLIEAYFVYIEGDFEWKTGSDDDGNPKDYKEFTRYPENASITGLALFLGFESRQSVYDYEKKGDDFSYTIKRARLRVEASYEQHLLSKNATGAIFALKNFGWADKQEVTNTNVNMNVEVTKEEAKEISKALDDKY